ncbi:hypothetical protein F0562_020071 [Nyssa sinensis]|uniref:Uncharacterized protein n=1 Tax=Nyssa sinensis TaxID=561372 RepID=A0A5J5BU56_9ASTE|nr:hypothetical protein F0562_020071 [Nyssa sinensis]
MDVPDFEGKLDPTVFSDWLASSEEYVDWYDMTDGRRLRFAKMKIVGLAKVWWTGVEGDIRRLGQPPIEVTQLLSNISDVAPEELPNELPPIRNVQHAIDLIPGSSLPNLPAYCMNPSEQKELNEGIYSGVCVIFEP